MKQADVTLQDVFLHERITDGGQDKVRAACDELLRALQHLHVNGIVHGDLKPLNIMRLREAGKERWRLIDLDVACSSRHSMNSKPPSSGYCPPEVAQKLLKAKRSGGELAECLKGYSATVSNDLWSFGVVLYQLCCARPLWKLNDDDNLASDTDLELLASWSTSLRDKLLREGGVTKRGHTALWDLLTKLLEPCPDQRLRHWGAEPEEAAMAVCKHPFVDPNVDSQEHKSLQELTDEIKQLVHMHDKLDDISGNVTLLLGRMEAQGTMMKEVGDLAYIHQHAFAGCSWDVSLTGSQILHNMLQGVKDIPRLVVFLPMDQQVRKNWLKSVVSNPGKMLEGMLSQTYKLHFVCALTLHVAGEGFQVTLAREWLVNAAPYLKVCLIMKAWPALRICECSSSGRLAVEGFLTCSSQHAPY
eukprot:366351-Chlamydomonas_euryale.AAC.14